MSYAIHVRVIQTKPEEWYSIVEKTVWHYGNGGTWADTADGEQTLSMGASGTSGMLRFRNAQGDSFLVALGVHNYKRWCDIVPDATPTNTGVQIHPSYYADAEGAAGGRGEMLWKQLAYLEKTTSTGVRIAVEFYKEDGNDLFASITINSDPLE